MLQSAMPADALKGKVALVTGASRGIGTAIALRLASEGAVVAVTARTVEPGSSRFAGTINETVEQIRAAGGDGVAIAADISREEDRVRLVSETEDRLGPVDILVNNAAVTYFQPIDGFPPRRRDLMFEVQVYAPMHLTQLVIPGMVDRGRGWIVNISSGAARHPLIPPDPARRAIGGTVYGMCKAALERFTTGLASELYNQNVAVNALSPNRVVPTPGTIHHHLVRPDDPDQLVEPPEVMAEAALALCAGPPKELTGRIAYSQDLLAELGRTVPSAT